MPDPFPHAVHDARRAIAAELLGTAALLAVVVGSGIMGQRLAAGNGAVALLANALATGFGLFVLITVLGPVSAAHFNPLVTVSACIAREIPARRAVAYVAAQFVGALAGVMLAHLMFDLASVQVGTQVRAGVGQLLGEAVATAGLLLAIGGFSRHAPAQLPAGVGAYIAAAYWFTSSTSFANPAVTLARAMTDTFAGIAPASTPWFFAGQSIGLLAGVSMTRWLFGSAPARNSPG